jgi:CheY-like chemotaxis protein
MDVSRLDAGIVDASLQLCSLQSIMERVAQDCAAEAEAKGVAFRCRPTTMGAVSDPVLLERVLRNLAANAVRYTSRGGVLIACRPRGNDVSVEVWDTGIGIADDKHDRIFDEFYQAGARDRREGLGLGLAIVRRLTQILGARISMRSVPGKGSVFKALLPGRSVVPAFVPSAPTTQTSQRLSAVANTVVLLIDDDTQVLEAMTEAMLGWGIRSVAARSLSQALERLPECERYPDAIVSDFHLGDDENGIDAVRRIRHELGVDVPAMIVTGDTAPQSLRLIRESGLPCLSKPVTADRLLQALGTLVASRPA